jgi:CRP/FNR family transcriptional regulator
MVELDKTNILQLIKDNFPQIVDLALQEEIAKVGKLMTFKAGETIMDYGSYIRLVPLVLTGSVKVVREDDEGREILLYYLYPGETCASSFVCCMMHKKSFIKTVAEDDTELIGIPIQYVDQWMNNFTNWKNFVMQSYDNRILELIQTIDSIAFMKMDERLLKYIYDKADAHDTDVLQVTHQEIAYDLNASREAVSRLLKKLEQQGMIKLGRNKIELLRM